MPESKLNEKVFKLVKKIPKGRVSTYKIIAETLGVKCYRAVGKMLNANKNLIEIPCHRVVSSNGFVNGYAKGMDKKIRLLKKEGINIRNKFVVDIDKVVFRFGKQKKQLNEKNKNKNRKL